MLFRYLLARNTNVEVDEHCRFVRFDNGLFQYDDYTDKKKRGTGPSFYSANILALEYPELYDTAGLPGLAELLAAVVGARKGGREYLVAQISSDVFSPLKTDVFLKEDKKDTVFGTAHVIVKPLADEVPMLRGTFASLRRDLLIHFTHAAGNLSSVKIKPAAR